ncbi:MAG: DUF2461 family protein, partial [Gemmataceae bacterium]
ALGPRFEAVLAATARFLHADFLDRADGGRWLDAVTRFHAAVSPLHADTARRRAGFLRHAAGSLLRGRASWPDKLHACLSPDGPYRVPGLGPAFWSALAQGTSPVRLPGWTPLTWRGLERLGLAPRSAAAGPGDRYGCLIDGHARLRRLAPQLTALHLDHVLSLVAVMAGRDLFSGGDALGRDPLAPRGRGDLRQTLKVRGQEIADGQEAFAAALEGGDAAALLDALGAVERGRVKPSALLLEWAGRFWRDDDPYPALERFGREQPVAGAGLWLPAAVLHLRDPLRFAPYGEALRDAQARLDDGVDPGDAPAERYRLFNALCEHVRKVHAVHPLQLPAALADGPASDDAERFAGFCPDTFRFLAELEQNNERAWMDRQRDRYRFAVRGPLVELCRALAAGYVEPVLNGRHGWGIDARAEAGHALTSVVKNSFGRGGPYTSTLWVAFCRAGRQGAQFFVRLDPAGLTYGLAARGDRGRLRAAVAGHADLLGRLAPGVPLDRDEISTHLPPDDPRLAAPTLADDIAEAFDRLLPLFACCQADDAGAALRVLAGEPPPSAYGEPAFRADTYLAPGWVARAVDLLRIKRQLVLQGVPGTGKTHVARCLARLLTGGDAEAVRVVQFHPGFSYEEFVEGIKVRTVEAGGRHDVTYPVEDGVLCSFAARAARSPGKPFVLVIDELNRGNLPRIFGELLYLLEYRGQAVELPCSRRTFGLPPNLYLIGTMNAADRSIAPLDQALRRRFSFLAMAPDAAVLTAWLAANPPPGGPAFASRVVGLFVKLNDRLRADLGAAAQVGHSHFMVPGLDDARLGLVWAHHVRPLLDELYAGRPERAEACDQLMERATRRAALSEKSDVH